MTLSEAFWIIDRNVLRNLDYETILESQQLQDKFPFDFPNFVKNIKRITKKCRHTFFRPSETNI